MLIYDFSSQRQQTVTYVMCRYSLYIYKPAYIVADDLCGIFVKSITEGSAAAQNGQIQVNDQIIEVNTTYIFRGEWKKGYICIFIQNSTASSIA